VSPTAILAEGNRALISTIAAGFLIVAGCAGMLASGALLWFRAIVPILAATALMAALA
jgi:hypothetical protein